MLRQGSDTQKILRKKKKFKEKFWKCQKKKL